MSNDLPSGWVESTLGEISKVSGGGTPDTSDESNFCEPPKGIPWMSPVDLSGYTKKFISSGRKNLTEKGFNASSAKILPKGTVLFSSRAPIGYVAIAQVPLTTNQGFRSLTPNHSIDSNYLYYYLMGSKAKAEELASGSTFKEISGSNLKKISIPIPPFAEQHRIAAKLDSILPRVEKVRERFEKIPTLLKRFRQSVLTAAVTGKLTEKWRIGNPKSASISPSLDQDFAKKKKWRTERGFSRGLETVNSELEYQFEIPIAWRWSNWGTISEWLTYGFTRPMPHVQSGIPIVTGKNVYNGSITIESSDLTTRDAYANLSEKDLPSIGDLLVTKDGSIGRSALVKPGIGPFCVNQSVAVVWLRTTTQNKRFLHFVIQSEYSQNFIKDFKQGVAIPHLSITDLARCPIPIPPIVEQEEIVRQVDKLFALADKLEAHYHRAMNRVEKFPRAILAKAFRGELVAQDPNDEPAKKLLERLRQEHARIDEGGELVRRKATGKPKQARLKAFA